MKLVVSRPTKIEVVAIKCEMAVRYEEQDIPNDFPLRNGDTWTGVVDIETGIIRDWPQGKEGSMHMKVCDEGTYTLLGPNDKVWATREEEYVPGCIPNSYGDYVDFDIDATGKIADWSRFCTERGIRKAFFFLRTDHDS
jgi:hypothetical protein